MEGEKNKLTCEHTSFPFFFFSLSCPSSPQLFNEKAVLLVKREIDLSFGLQGRLGHVGSRVGIQAHAVFLTARFFPGFSPACFLSTSHQRPRASGKPHPVFFSVVTGGQWAAFGCWHSSRERQLGRWIYPKGRRLGCLHTSSPEETLMDASQGFPWGNSPKPLGAPRSKTQFTACRPEVLRLLEEQPEEGRE